MKIILLAMLLLVCVGCEVSEGNAQSSKKTVDNYTVYRNNSEAVVDGCEYFFNHEDGSLTHKGNCENCREFYKELFKRVQQ